MSVELSAWIQMGVERRETTIDIPRKEYEAGAKWVSEDPGRLMETWLEELVLDWLHVQYGWGWSSGEYYNDFGFMEGSDEGGAGLLALTADASIPNTRAYRLDLAREQVRCPCCNRWTPSAGASLESRG